MALTLRVFDFTRYPGPRYRRDGPYSAEQFREEHLEPRLREAIENGETLAVVLDGVSGYGSSFLEETFGGLVRRGFGEDALDDHLQIVNLTPRFEHHKLRAEQYIKDAVEKSRDSEHRMVG